MSTWLLFFWSIPLFLYSVVNWKSDSTHPFLVSLSINSEKISLDDLIEFEANFQYPSDYQLDLQSLIRQLTWSANPLNPSWNLLQSSQSTKKSQNGIESSHFRVLLAPTKEGSLDLTLFTVHFIPKDQTKSPLDVLTPLFSIQVLPLAKEQNLPPLAPLIPLEPEFPLGLSNLNREQLINNPQKLEESKFAIQQTLSKHTFPWITLAILLGLGGIGWAAFLTRDLWFRPILKPLPSKPIKQQVEEALSELSKQGLPQNKLFKEYYTQLSSILSIIIQSFIDKNIHGMTSQEIFTMMQNDPKLPYELKNHILSLIEEIDRVKYAKVDPSLESSHEIFHQIHDLSQQLR